jgi:hypothetical protein
MARAAKAAGFAVATRIKDHGVRILAEGCRLIPLQMQRGSLAIEQPVVWRFRLPLISHPGFAI